jgi:cation diffusion facilitator family transporter
LKTANQNFKIQKFVALLSVLLFAIKLYAWFQTHSVAILTDALESIVNVIASFIGLYSLYISAKPKDSDHPYGHGKVELISAAIEGMLIGIAGFMIIREAVLNLYHPHQVEQIDMGLLLIIFTAALNFIAGKICVRNGLRNNSQALIASGKHLITDTYTSIGIIVGLILLYFTNIIWIDSVVAIVFAFMILYTGYKIIRSSISGMMDEADVFLLNKMVDTLNKNRSINWIDLHNLRIIKYGSMIHLDCHLTVPWYFNVYQAHEEIDALSSMVNKTFGESFEMFVHTDGCMDFSCSICSKMDCNERKHPFQKKIDWTLDNILRDKKHSISTSD